LAIETVSSNHRILTKSLRPNKLTVISEDGASEVMFYLTTLLIP
jgi:hypothetical protein